MSKNSLLFILIVTILFYNSFLNLHYVFSQNATSAWGTRCRQTTKVTGIGTGCSFLYSYNAGVYQSECRYCATYAVITEEDVSGKNLCRPSLTNDGNDCFVCNATGSAIQVTYVQKNFSTSSEACGGAGVPCCTTGSPASVSTNTGATIEDSGTDCYAPDTSSCWQCD